MKSVKLRGKRYLANVIKVLSVTFETDLAQLSILETELKERPVNRAALSLSFLKTKVSLPTLLSMENNP